MTRLTFVTLTAALLGLTACGSSSSNGGNGTNGGNTKPAAASEAGRCEMNQFHACMEFPTSAIKSDRDAQEAAQSCQEQNGTFAMGGCPAQNHVGTCHVTGDGGIPIKVRFYAPVTTDRAQAACQQQGGQFSPNY